MRIRQIKQEEYIFHITLSPNWLEKLFGIRDKYICIKDTGREFTFGGGTVYKREDGSLLRNGSYIGESVDNWRRKF